MKTVLWYRIRSSCIHMFGRLHNPSLNSAKSIESKSRLMATRLPCSYSKWSTEGYSAHYSSSTGTGARRSRSSRPGSVKVDIAEGSNSDSVRHLHIWLMPDDWHSKEDFGKDGTDWGVFRYGACSRSKRRLERLKRQDYQRIFMWHIFND